MLNSHSKKFLKFLRKSHPDFDEQIYTYDFIQENYPENIESIYATIRFLEKQGYLEYGSVNERHIGVALTESSLHPHQFAWVEIKSFLLRSIFTPILVSFLTTLLTLWLTA